MISRIRHLRYALTFLLGVSIIGVLGCSDKKTNEVLGDNSIHGVVRYNGQLVKSGFVLFYVPEKAINKKQGSVKPTFVARIQSDGSYKATKLPEGPLMVCLATDPDMESHELVKESGIGGMPVGKGPMGKGPMGKGPMGPPDAKDKDKETHIGENGKVKIDPKDLPKDAPSHKAGPHKQANLTDKEKATLKEIHQKYSTFGMSPLMVVVRKGDTAIDIDAP